MRGASSWRRSRKSSAGSARDTSMVFTIAVVVFALTFIVAGRCRTSSGPSGFRSPAAVLVSLGFFLCCVHPQPDVPVHLFRRHRRAGQRLRLRDADSGDGQVVSRQARAGGRTGGRRIRRRVGDLRTARQSEAHSGLWRAHHLPDSGRNLPGDDGDWRVPAEESSRGIQARGMDAAPATARSGATTQEFTPGEVLRRRRSTSCGWRTRWALGRSDGHQPTGAVRQERGHLQRGPGHHDAGGRRGRQRLGTNSVGLDVGPAGPHQRAAADDWHLA